MMQDYSQAGEVNWILNNVKLPEKGYFVDVGAHDGRTDSNTYWFEKKMGWEGLCIEPHPQMGQLLHAHRKCKIAQCAVGSKDVEKFYISEISSWSGTTPPKGAYHEMVVPMRGLDSLCRQFNLPRVDVLSVDTEGTEIDILTPFGLFYWGVRVLVVEWDSQSREKGNNEQAIRDFMGKGEGKHFDFGAKIGANLIFVRKGYAIQESSSGTILQCESEEAGKTGGECVGMEQSQQGQEVAQTSEEKTS